MDTTRRWIQQVRYDNQRVIHNTNELVTVVNHTFAEVRLDRKHIRDIEVYVSKLHGHMTTWIAISTIAFERVCVSLRIDQCLLALESYNFWFHQRDLYRRQRAALESGLLTEDFTASRLRTHFSRLAAEWDSMPQELNGFINVYAL